MHHIRPAPKRCATRNARPAIPPTVHRLPTKLPSAALDSEQASVQGLGCGCRTQCRKIEKYQDPPKTKPSCIPTPLARPDQLTYTPKRQPRMQADCDCGATWRKAGMSWAHCATALGQRVRNTQPEGWLMGEGKSPCNNCSVLPRSIRGSGTGIADSNAWV